MTPATEAASPVKVHEYLACGLPVVSVEIPEVARYRDNVKVARDRPEFIRLIEQALTERSLADKRRRSDLVRNETWEQRLDVLSAIIARHARPLT